MKKQYESPTAELIAFDDHIRTESIEGEGAFGMTLMKGDNSDSPNFSNGVGESPF